MKITIENQYGKYTVEVLQEDMNISDTFEKLVEPCLYAMGFSEGAINEYLSNE